MPPSWDQEKYVVAYRCAADAHRTQTVTSRPDLPYIIHPSLVSMEVMAALQAESGLDGNLALQCALLHDVVEDTDISANEIQARFGKSVAMGVMALSKDKSLDPSDRMADCLRRIRKQPREVWIVKLADRITNLQPPPGDWTQQKIEDYRLESVQILDALGEASSLLANRLREKIRTYGQARVP